MHKHITLKLGNEFDTQASIAVLELRVSYGVHLQYIINYEISIVYCRNFMNLRNLNFHLLLCGPLFGGLCPTVRARTCANMTVQIIKLSLAAPFRCSLFCLYCCVQSQSSFFYRVFYSPRVLLINT